MSQSACTHTYDPHTGACQYCGVELIIVPMTFDGLLDVAERILTAHYPSDIFPTPIGDTRDPGVQLVTAVRAVVDAAADVDALSPIHPRRSFLTRPWRCPCESC